MATLKTLSQVEAVTEELRSRGLSKKRVRKRFEIKIKTFRSVAAWSALWVSASDIGRTPGQFQWPDGTPVDNATWDNRQPNKAKEGQETCVYLYTEDAKLFDISCSDTAAYILCEIPAALSTCIE
jgi:Lectin C-type domain